MEDQQQIDQIESFLQIIYQIESVLKLLTSRVFFFMHVTIDAGDTTESSLTLTR